MGGGNPLTGWSRKTLAERVEELSAAHEGPAFVAEVERFAEELNDEERGILGELLVKRAGGRGAFEYGLHRRIDEPRWKVFGRRPAQPGR